MNVQFASGRLPRRSGFLQYLPAAATPLTPVIDLPSFTTYDAATDLVRNTGFDTAYDETGFSVIDVADAGVLATNQTNLQAAINTAAASSGSTVIKVEAGGNYGCVVLKARPDVAANVGWIYIRPDDVNYALLPPPSNGLDAGTQTNRVHPSDAAHMFTLANHTTQANIPVTLVDPIAVNVCKYRIVGAELTGGNFGENLGCYGLVHIAALGGSYRSTAITSAALMPSWIGFDRCYLHGIAAPTTGTKQGIRFECNYGFAVDCYGTDINSNNAEVKWVLAIDGTKLKVQNCAFGGAGIAWLFGGSKPSFDGHLPSDIFMDRNHWFTPYEWNPYHPRYDSGDYGATKNKGEVKFGLRIWNQRSVFENQWQSGQSYLINMKTEASYASPAPQTTWAASQHIGFRHCFMLSFSGGLGLSGHTIADATGIIDEYEAQRTAHIDIVNVVLASGTANDFKDVGEAHDRALVVNRIGAHRIARVTVLAPDMYRGGIWFYGGTVGDIDLSLDDKLSGGVYRDLVIAGAFPAESSGDGTGVILESSLDAAASTYNSGYSAINNVSRAGWSLQGIGLAANGAYTTAQKNDIALLDTEGGVPPVFAENTDPLTVVQTPSVSAPAAGDYTIVLPAFLNAGTGGRTPGADWATLSALLAGVREDI